MRSSLSAFDPTFRNGLRLRSQLSSIAERLLRVMDSEYIPVWINKPIPSLDDRKPLELIARGQYRRVAQVVSALEEPVADSVELPAITGARVGHEAVKSIEDSALNRWVESLQIAPSRRRDLMRPA
jgi:hypothetical protein